MSLTSTFRCLSASSAALVVVGMLHAPAYTVVFQGVSLSEKGATRHTLTQQYLWPICHEHKQWVEQAEVWYLIGTLYIDEVLEPGVEEEKSKTGWFIPNRSVVSDISQVVLLFQATRLPIQAFQLSS